MVEKIELTILKMKEQYNLFKFERLNSKQNRLWEQFTTLITFTGTIISVFLGSLVGIDRIKYAENVDFAYNVIVLLVGLLALMIGRLFSEITKNKKHLGKFLNEIRLNCYES